MQVIPSRVERMREMKDEQIIALRSVHRFAQAHLREYTGANVKPVPPSAADFAIVSAILKEYGEDG